MGDERRVAVQTTPETPERRARRLFDEMARNIGRETVNYMKAMYPGTFIGQPSTAELSMVNHIRNDINYRMRPLLMAMIAMHKEWEAELNDAPVEVVQRALPTPDALAPGSKLYVVTGVTGEYSDRSEWLVRAHSSEAGARADVETLTAKWAELTAGLGYYQDEYDVARSAMKAFDPGFRVDYTGTSWFVQEVPSANPDPSEGR